MRDKGTTDERFDMTGATTVGVDVDEDFLYLEFLFFGESMVREVVLRRGAAGALLEQLQEQLGEEEQT